MKELVSQTNLIILCIEHSDVEDRKTRIKRPVKEDQKPDPLNLKRIKYLRDNMLIRTNDLKYFINKRNLTNTLKILFEELEEDQINTDKIFAMGHGLGGSAVI